MIKGRCAVVVYIGLLILLMTLPLGNDNINDTFVVGFRADYIIHCVIYLPWMFLCNPNYRTIWFIGGVATVTLLECVQRILPYRGFNINDIIAGVIGVLLSYLFTLIYRKMKTKYNG